MVKQDGTRVQGIAQVKEEAKSTYDKAIKDGKTASIMHVETPDVFQVLVGNIPPNEDVRIQLTYATEPTEDETNDSVRLNIPSHTGERYGEPSVAGTGSANAFINISVSVESVAPITQIGSFHAISTELGPDPLLPNAASLPSSHYARVSLTSDTPLNRDFVLALTSSGLDAPRCIEPHLTQDSVGVMFSFVPRFTLPDVP